LSGDAPFGDGLLAFPFPAAGVFDLRDALR
jgi:hypothetical protein